MIMIFARSITKSDFQIFKTVVLFNYCDSDARLTCKMFINSAYENIQMFSSNIVLILLLYG